MWSKQLELSLSLQPAVLPHRPTCGNSPPFLLPLSDETPPTHPSTQETNRFQDCDFVVFKKKWSTRTTSKNTHRATVLKNALNDGPEEEREGLQTNWPSKDFRTPLEEQRSKRSSYGLVDPDVTLHLTFTDLEVISCFVQPFSNSIKLLKEQQEAARGREGFDH